MARGGEGGVVFLLLLLFVLNDTHTLDLFVVLVMINITNLKWDGVQF
jgi:hypothetical protein